MWIRTVMLMFAIGCVTTGNTTDDREATVEQHSMSFECLNHTAIHVVTCHGTIALFPITVTIEDIRILSDNEILDYVEAVVLYDFLNEFLIEVNGNGVSVCTVVGGLPLCK